MNGIPSDFQEKLIEFLCGIESLCNAEENRTSLLTDFPLAGDIKRSQAYRSDIRVIVRNVLAWGRATKEPFKGKYFLQIFMERTRQYIEGSEKEQSLDELLKDFENQVGVDDDMQGWVFVNRIDEIKQITSPPVYYLVDAPAGYGKTHLLQELRKRFKGAGWRCVYVLISKGTIIHTVIGELASGLQVDIGTNNVLEYGERLGRAILQSKEIVSEQGIMLLLDLEGEPELSVFKELTQNLISTVQSTLADKIPFRVVIAGRHLVMTEEYRKAKIPFAIVVPTLFNYSVVREYVKEEKEMAANADEIAAHLTHFTGGHPKCILFASAAYRELAVNMDLVSVLKLSPDLSPSSEPSMINGEEFVTVTALRELIICDLDRITKEKIQEIYAGFPFSEELRHFIVRLSLYRYFDHAMLADLRKETSFSDGSISALEDRLTETYLFDRQGRWIENKITRRVLVLWLQHNASEEYPRLCNQAKELCITGLKRPREREPEIWVTEYLFQCLQSSIGDIKTIGQRKAISEVFWNQEFPYIMREYFGPDPLDDQIDYAKKRLINRIETDWELQFVVNYYLRTDKYTENPYWKLRTSIETFDPAAEMTPFKNLGERYEC